MNQHGTFVGVGRQGPTRRTKDGFTLVEVIFASTLTMLLFLVLLETLSVCRRIAADIKWRLAADALAYDVAWDVFNRKTSWFEANATQAQAAWLAVPTNRTSVWVNGQKAYYYQAVIPVGTPATHWQIIADVQWPLPDGGAARLSQPYVVERHRADRNLFRNTP